MKTYFPILSSILALCCAIALSACRPQNDLTFDTLKAAKAELEVNQLPNWLPNDASFIKVQFNPHDKNQFLRFKTTLSDSWLPNTCYQSNFINQLPNELPIWWPTNATEYRQIDTLYQLYLCKDQDLWWVAIPRRPEFVLMWQ